MPWNGRNDGDIERWISTPESKRNNAVMQLKNRSLRRSRFKRDEIKKSKSGGSSKEES